MRPWPRPTRRSRETSSSHAAGPTPIRRPDRTASAPSAAASAPPSRSPTMTRTARARALAASTAASSRSRRSLAAVAELALGSRPLALDGLPLVLIVGAADVAIVVVIAGLFALAHHYRNRRNTP
jgi:hypothetical protein